MKSMILDEPSGIYRVTTEGDVYSQSKVKIPIVGKGREFTGKYKYILKPERKLKYTLNNRGYYSVSINKKTKMVHRLVAEAFCENHEPESKIYVNHKDGNKLNNKASNLEWVTCAENLEHARITGLHKQAKGHKIKYKSEKTKKRSLSNLKDKSKLTADEVRYCRKVFKARDKEFSATALANKFGTSIAAMAKIVKGVTYTHIK